MERYQVFYREKLIGMLSVDADTGRHMYEPEASAVAELQSGVPLTREMREGTEGFVEPIPFFQNRLMNMRRWGLDEINYQTDYFLLKRVE